MLYPLSLVLNRVLAEEGELAELVEGRIVNIFLLFSQAENHVKETVADRMVLKRMFASASYCAICLPSYRGSQRPETYVACPPGHYAQIH